MPFAEFPQQGPSVALLQRSLDRGRLAHAYLFSGMVSSELGNVARTLAKALNCKHPPVVGKSGVPLDSCDRCQTCHRIDAGNHPDVQWVRPESKSRLITIDPMREAMHAIQLRAAEANYKVAIIEGADRLNVQAANAFLKTLEEPPPRSVMLLLTTEPERVLETIVSRCLRLNFTGEPELAASAGAALVRSFGEFAAREKKGGLLSRYRLLGMLLSRLAQIKSETQKRLTAGSPLEKYDELDPKLRDRWENELAAAIEAEYRQGRAEVLSGLHWWLRDVWLHTAEMGHDLLAFPASAEASRTIAAGLSEQDAVENLRVFEQLQQLLQTNVQEALALEVGFLKLKL
jgi:DNA polymerase-3 subunit delta'